MAKPKKSKKVDTTPVPTPEPELTPRQQKEKRREEARARAAETRKIVTAGTAAWTGKLPAQLLNEYCQKLKWERVEYSVKGSGENFRASVTLAKRNLKTREIERVRMEQPTDQAEDQPTALEARHLAATYALHRIASTRNFKMMLPPNHRDMWIRLDQQKSIAQASSKWKWAEDPFAAAAERKESKEKFAAGAMDRKIRNEAAETRRAISEAQNATIIEGPDSSIVESKPRVRFNAKLTLSRQMRSAVEKVLRDQRGLRFSKSDGADKKTDLWRTLHIALIKLGFESFQVNEALMYASNLNNALIWLLIHVPEDDLPKAFAPADLTVRVSGTATKEQAVSRIREFGYAEDVARDAITSEGSVAGAMALLTAHLAEVKSLGTGDPGMWAEELESLQAVYDTQFYLGKSNDEATILLPGIKMSVTFFQSPKYPAEIPGIGLKTEQNRRVPKYVLLDATRRAAEFAATELAGNYMLAELAQRIEDTFEEVLRSPNPLMQISSGVSGFSEQASKKERAATKATRKPMSRISLDSAALKQRFEDRCHTPRGEEMLRARQQLPAWKKRDEVVSLLEKHRVLLITGETGSGKSTQIVQFVLDHLIESSQAGNTSIVCTQPRRISAIGVASRVAEERSSELGAEVGYVIRGESRISSNTQIRFVTAGVLLRMLQMDVDGTLAAITHIFVDEVHERSLDGDFLLMLLKRVLRKFRSLKVVLMSATVDPKQFRDYFSEGIEDVGYVHITGRTFPVAQFWLPDVLKTTKYVPRGLDASPGDVGKIVGALRDNGGLDFGLIAATVEHIHETIDGLGSVLVFMSGAAEIDRAMRAIQALPRAAELWILPLHASLPPAEQRHVFQSAPRGLRKVICCTNVAETSITIADIVAVVDSGRVKETIYDSKVGVTRLVDSWASQASAAQRMGRAGRVRAGTCFRLYTEAIYENKMQPRPLPEMLRAPLDVLYLNVKAMGIANVERFLAGAMDPPPMTALDAARKTLLEIGALNNSGILTPLGLNISLLPTDPRTAKLLILGAILGCLPRALTVAAVIGLGKPLLQSPKDVPEIRELHSQFNIDNSGDLIAACRAYEAWTCAPDRKWPAKYHIGFQALRDIQSSRQQLLGALTQTGLVPPGKEANLNPEFSVANDSLPVLRAVIGAALQPQIAYIALPQQQYKSTVSGAFEVDPEARKIAFYGIAGNRIYIHPRSMLFGSVKFGEDERYLSYCASIISTKHYMSDLTPLSNVALALFAVDLEIDPLGAGVIVDGWTGLKCWPRAGVLLRFLQQQFSDLLSAKFENPALSTMSNSALRIVRELVETEGRGRDRIA